MASAYLSAFVTGETRRSNLRVLTEARVRRVLFEGITAVGVEAEIDGELVAMRADQVVVSAGAIGSPALLFASGIGPAVQLRASGVEVLANLPGVGAELFNHPVVDLTYQPTPELLRNLDASAAGLSFMQLALHTSSANDGPGDFEFMATRVPYGVATGREPSDTLLSMRATLSRPTGRGELSFSLIDGWTSVRVNFRAGGTEADSLAMRAAVRIGSELLRSPHFERLIEVGFGPTPEQLSFDSALDVWISANRSYAFHPMGTCAMGSDADEGGVVDPRFRVRGVEGLAVVDASVIPVPLSRGPAAMVVALAEAAAEVIGECR